MPLRGRYKVQMILEQGLGHEEKEHTLWDARVLRAGHSLRISPGRKGFKGWALSLTRLEDTSLKGQGGG